MDGGAWWVTVRGVAKSRTRLSDFTHSLTHFALSTHTIRSLFLLRPLSVCLFGVWSLSLTVIFLKCLLILGCLFIFELRVKH